MPKAVHLTSVHNPFDNRLFYKECKTLKKAGYEVTLIAPHSIDEVVEGIKILGVEENTSKYRRVIQTVFQVFRRAIKEDADIYHIHDPELLLVGFILYMKGYNVIFDMHENVPKSIRSKEWIPSYLRSMVELVYKGIETVALKKMSVIFAENSYQDEYAWIKNSETILNFPRVNKILNIKTSKNGRHGVGYIGKVTNLRGATTTIEALSLLKQKGNKITFECVGTSPDNEFSNIKEKAKEHEVDANFHGFKPSIEGLKIISSCQLGLAILKDIPNYRHSYPTKIFEYMAVGLPVIASDFPLYRSIVEDNKCGFCVDPDNIHDIASAIQKLDNNPGLAQEMGENGKKIVQERFTWDNQASKLLNFYSQILRK